MGEKVHSGQLKGNHEYFVTFLLPLSSQWPRMILPTRYDCFEQYYAQSFQNYISLNLNEHSHRIQPEVDNSTADGIKGQFLEAQPPKHGFACLPTYLSVCLFQLASGEVSLTILTSNIIGEYRRVFYNYPGTKMNGATLRLFSLVEPCHTQNFYLRCFKSDFDAVKNKFDLLIEQMEKTTFK